MGYHVDYSANIYNVIQNGIETELNTTKEVFKKAEEISKTGIPAIFNVSNGSAELIDPYEIGLNNKASHCVYMLYKENTNHTTNKIKKIAESITKSGNDDLSDYLYLAMSFSKNKKQKNIYSIYSKIFEELKKESKPKARMFEFIYKTASEAAVAEGIDNVDNIALMSAMQRVGWKKAQKE